MSRNGAGRKKLEAALSRGDLDALLLTLSRVEVESSAKRISPIYTVDEFLAAARKPAKKSPSREIDVENNSAQKKTAS